MTQSSGLSALSAVLQHEMDDHVKDLERHVENLERQLAEAAEREAKLQRAFDEAHDDFLGFQGDMASMGRALRQRLYPGLSDADKHTFDSYHRSFWYVVQDASDRSEKPYPREEESDESDDDPLELEEWDQIMSDPIQWPMFNGQHPSQM